MAPLSPLSPSRSALAARFRRRTRNLGSAALCLLLAGTTACVHEIPPPPAPERKLPAIEDPPDDPPEAGSTHVILDAEDGPADVRVVVGTVQGVGSVNGRVASWHAVTTRRLCRTPCGTTLPRGDHTLVFASPTDETRVSTAETTVGSRPLAVRHAVGRVESHPGLLIGGLTLLPLGLTTLAVGGVAAGTVGDEHQSLAYGALGVGALFTVIGVAMLCFGRTDVQPGTTTQWTLGDYSASPQQRKPSW